MFTHLYFVLVLVTHMPYQAMGVCWCHSKEVSEAGPH